MEDQEVSRQGVQDDQKEGVWTADHSVVVIYRNAKHKTGPTTQIPCSVLPALTAPCYSLVTREQRERNSVFRKMEQKAKGTSADMDTLRLTSSM